MIFFEVWFETEVNIIVITMDYEDESNFGGLYEDGHWVWDDVDNGLMFVRLEHSVKLAFQAW